MKILILCVIFLAVVAMAMYASGLFDKTPEDERDLQWLNRKYLFHLNEAKKNNDKNEPVAEFHMEEAARYKELMNRMAGKVFMDEMKKPPSLP